jgi:Carboxypeptidase regulatory-like domain
MRLATISALDAMCCLLACVILVLMMRSTLIESGPVGRERPSLDETEEEPAGPAPGRHGARCVGTVFQPSDEDSRRPLPGARLRIYEYTDNTADVPWVRQNAGSLLDCDTLRGVSSEAKTSEAGTFSIEIDPRKTWLLVADHRGFGPAALVWREGDEPPELELTPAPARMWRVEDADGVPVEGADVFVISAAGIGAWSGLAIVHTVSGSGGEFTISIPDRGRLAIRAPGFGTCCLEYWDALEAESIVLQRAVRVEGTVVDQDGAPVQGASVILDPMDEYRELAVTSATGRFAFDSLSGRPDHGYPLIAEKEGYVSARGQAYSGTVGLQLVLQRTGDVSGRVSISDGRDAGTVSLRWAHSSWLWQSPLLREVALDGDGRFLLTEVPPGAIILHAKIKKSIPTPSGPLFVTTDAVRTVLRVPPDGRRDGVLLALSPVEVSYLRLRITDSARRPLARSTFLTWAVMACDRSRVADSQGELSAAFALPPDTPVAITVGPPPDRRNLCGARFVLRTSSDPAAEPHDVVLEERPGLVVLLRAADGHLIGESVDVQVTLDGVALTRTGSDRFDLAAGMRPGAVLCVTVPGESPRVVRRLGQMDLEGDAVEVVLPTESVLTGRLVPPQDWPLRDGVVCLLRCDLTWSSPLSIDRRDGRFRVRGAPPGLYLVDFSSMDGGRDILFQVDLRPGCRSDVGEIRRDHRIAGRVLDTNGSPIGDASVEILAAGVGVRCTRQTGGDGVFSFHNPSLPGAWLEIRSRGRATAYRPLPEGPGTRSLVVRLEREGPVRIRLNPAPSPDCPVSFHVRTPVGMRHCEGIPRPGLGGGAGIDVFELRGLPAGDRLIRVKAYDAAGRRVSCETAVTVVPGSTREATIDLGPGSD